jgi:hypothetical protein
MATVTSVVQPYPVFPDLDGIPLEDGNVYVGLVNQNPLIEANRVAVYADSGLTVPIAQPIKTLAGVLVRSGTPTYVYVSGVNYSIVITDRQGRLVYSSLNAPQEQKTLVVDASTINYPQTAAEATAGVVPLNTKYPSHDYIGRILPERYGAVGNGVKADVVNGALDTTAINSAILVNQVTGCEIQLSRKYIAVPATVTTQEGAVITVAWPILTNMHIRAIDGASITLADNQSTDATPKSVALFHTNGLFSKASFKDIIFDLNGANNPISPGRPAVYQRAFNMAAISVSGTPAGVAARGDDVVVTGNTFKNCPGTCALVTGQSNSTGVTLGERWTIKNNLFLNNGTDTDDHTSIFAWNNTVICEGNVFWEDQPPHTVGKTGGATCYEVHGSHHRLEGNYFFNYTLGAYIASNFSTETIDTVVVGNNFYCSDYGILVFRQQTPASAALANMLIEGNTFYFDNWTYVGQPTVRAAVRFQGQLSTQQLAVSNIKIHGNHAIAAGTTLNSNFVRWDTVTTVTPQVCSNLTVTDNTAIGFTEGVYMIVADNNQGYTNISGNDFISLTPDGLGNLPRGIHILFGAAPVILTTLVIDGNKFIDERAVPVFSHGVYLDGGGAGTVTDFYFGPQVYKGLTVANYTEINTFTVTNWKGPARDGVATVTYSANMTPDWSAGTSHVITVTNAVAHTLNLPTRGRDGSVIQLTIRNASGGVLGAITFDANYGKSAWTQPANNFNRSIAFRKNGAIWTQINQTGVDVPN